MKDQTFTDDSSRALGLGHNVSGQPLDAKGRPIVVLPPPTDGYDPELVDKTPDQIVEILKGRTERAEDNPNLDRLMREVPGGNADHKGSSSGGRRREPNRPRPDRTMQSIVEIEMTDLRPIVVSGRVSQDAYAGLYADGNPGFGEIAELVGRTLRTTPWREVENALRLVKRPA